MEDKSEISVNGVQVSFARRDIKQVTDKELNFIKKFIEKLQNEYVADDREIQSIVIESDWIDINTGKYVVKYTTSTRLSELVE